MCAIVDANCWHEVFSGTRPEAGEAFYRWIERGDGRAVVGGALLRDELAKGHGRMRLIQELQLMGMVLRVDDAEVDEAAAEIEQGGLCRSNDTHIVALARVGRATLLYSNDGDLHQDFTNPALLKGGKVYSTQQSKDFRPSQRKLLERHRCPQR